MSSQTDRLMDLLADFQWHDTPEILRVVYGGDHLGIARIAARVGDAKERLEKFNQTIESRPKAGSETVWEYRKKNVVQQQVMPPYDLFRGGAEAV